MVVFQPDIGWRIDRKTTLDPTFPIFYPDDPWRIHQWFLKHGLNPNEFELASDKKSLSARKENKEVALEAIFDPEALERLYQEHHNRRKFGHENDNKVGLIGLMYELLVVARLANNNPSETGKRKNLAAYWILTLNIESRIMGDALRVVGVAEYANEFGVHIAPNIKRVSYKVMSLVFEFMADPKNRRKS